MAYTRIVDPYHVPVAFGGPDRRDYKKGIRERIADHRVSTNIEDRREPQTQIYEDDPFNKEDDAITKMSIGRSMRIWHRRNESVGM